MLHVTVNSDPALDVHPALQNRLTLRIIALGALIASQEGERNDPLKSGGGRGGLRDHPHLAIDCGFMKANNPHALGDTRSG